ncbi:TetR family transcriptional regulator C-terminal domain-containing protein [Spongiimicrobium salis]|uniref:TetR family transcriptional regulator C-terminal domain-containing protein n=1 Tax=Spongiimicrobium salis TaxID=1667022 RepID=UPI00374CBD7D
MTAKSTSKKHTEDTIIALYMDDVLENGVLPKSVYKFCKNNAIEEQAFYAFFGSFEGLRKRIWMRLYENTEAVMEKNEEYASFSNREKLLTFFFSFFELLTLNRSYVLFALQESGSPLKGLTQLKELRNRLKEFATMLIEEANSTKTLKITKHNPKLFSEGVWLQFLFLLKFWMDDTSAGFEKTDLAIEKSVNTAFDLFDNTPLDSIIDFGKFLYKENFA